MSLSDDPKYQEYLASREWALLKEKVKDRARNICERCLSNVIQAVHHKTYIRKYNELLEDLWGLCRPCHEFIHAKSAFDPMPQITVYLSGKNRFKQECVKHVINVEFLQSLDVPHPAVIFNPTFINNATGNSVGDDLQSYIKDIIYEIEKSSSLLCFLNSSDSFDSIVEVTLASSRKKHSYIIIETDATPEQLKILYDVYRSILYLPNVSWYLVTREGVKNAVDLAIIKMRVKAAKILCKICGEWFHGTLCCPVCAKKDLPKKKSDCW